MNARNNTKPIVRNDTKLIARNAANRIARKCTVVAESLHSMQQFVLHATVQ